MRKLNYGEDQKEAWEHYSGVGERRCAPEMETGDIEDRKRLYEVLKSQNRQILIPAGMRKLCKRGKLEIP